MLYLLHEAPPREQNFGMVMEMLESAEVREEDESYQSPLDVLFELLLMLLLMLLLLLLLKAAASKQHHAAA